jgi:hypothetical protein
MYVHAPALETAAPTVFMGWVRACSNPNLPSDYLIFNILHWLQNLTFKRKYRKMYIRLSCSELSVTWQSNSMLCKNQPRFKAAYTTLTASKVLVNAIC